MLILGITAAPAQAATPTAAEAAIQRFHSDYLSDTFEAIASEVAFEPYTGLQRGAEGTALSGSGNSIDKALLLARAIEGNVATWRLVQGRLNDTNLTHLLSESSPSLDAPSIFTDDGLELYDPINDHAIRKIARDHFWLEVQQEPGDDWQALDPTFPQARMGDSYANGNRTYTDVPAGQKQQLTLTFMQQTADGRTSRLGKVNGAVADLARFPINLVARGIPQYEKQTGGVKSSEPLVGSGAGGLLGGDGGGMFGGGAKKAPAPVEPAADSSNDDATERELVGTEIRRELTYGGKEPESLKTTMVTDADSASKVTREWIEFSLHVPGQRARTFNRDLFVAHDTDDAPAPIRRYSIAVVAGEVSRTMFDDYRGALNAADVSDAYNTLVSLKEQPASNETALEILQLESSGALAPYLINLAFAFESDELTARLAAAAGVRVVRDVPRVLITSIEADVAGNGEAEISTTLDLRLDEVVAIPAAGWPVGASELFQRSRGMQESALEGRVLSQFVEDSNVVTTEQVLREAQKQGHSLVAITPENRTAIDDLTSLPAAVAARIVAALDAGHQVIVPASAATIDGRQHWGWWDVDPMSGAFVGVMESGQHQAMTQYTVTLEEIGVNDAMGYIIGAMVGSTATLTLYSAKMIEYGQVTPQLIREVAAGIEQLTCVICPSFEVVVSPMQATASFSSQCFGDTGVGAGLGVGVSGSIDFCENYKTGISCAASLLLGTFEVTGQTSLGSNVGANLGPLSCD